MSGFNDISWGDITEGLNEEEEEGEFLDSPSSSFYEDEQQEEPALTAPSYFDEQMSEAEQRLHKATMYRQFLTGRIFDGASDQLTLDVEQEFREFAQHRLSVLLGIGTTSAFGGQFTDTEAKVLKLLAGSALKNAKVAKAAERQPTVLKPTARTQQAPPPPSRPTLRSRPLPEVARPQKRQPAQQFPQPQQRPQQTQQRPQQTQQRPQRPQQTQQQAPTQPQVPQDGEIFQIAGKNYKASWVQMGPDEYGASVAQKLEKLPPGRSVVLPNGIQVMKTDGEEYFKIVKRDLTPSQVVSTGGIPFPSTSQMVAITQMKSAEAIQNLPRNAQGIAGKITSE